MKSMKDCRKHPKRWHTVEGQQYYFTKYDWNICKACKEDCAGHVALRASQIITGGKQ